GHGGTFPLREAQLDRFLVRLSLGYPSIEEEFKMLTRLQRGHPIDDLNPVVSAADFVACQETIRELHMDEKVQKYILQIVHATREHDEVQLGGSPRASIALFRTAQAMAAMAGRDYVLPDDVKRMAHPVLGHRLILKPRSRLRKVTVESVIKEILMEVSVPITARQQEEAEDLFAG